jgi:hypothetical protein
MLQGLARGALLVMQGFDMLEPRLNTHRRGFAVLGQGCHQHRMAATESARIARSHGKLRIG